LGIFTIVAIDFIIENYLLVPVNLLKTLHEEKLELVVCVIVTVPLPTPPKEPDDEPDC
jgi:hypothetical protein